MNKPQMNLQDNFLNQARKEGIPVTVYLVSGVQLKGVVRGFDAFTVVLETPGKPSQLVYKHAVASVVPARPIRGLVSMEDRQPEQAQGQAPAAAPPAAPAPTPAPEPEPEPAPAEEPAEE